MREKETEKAPAREISAADCLPPAAQRALQEAAARRAAAAAKAQRAADPKEHGGRKAGKEPTRFGDWEFNGRAIDF